jgi:hypothetical protein
LVKAGKHVNNIRDIAKQLVGKRVPAATDTHATVYTLLGCNSGNGVYYVVRAEILFAGSVEFRVEARPNTPTVALGVLEVDGKGTPYLWGYNQATMLLEDINTGTWPPRLGESRI